MLEAIAIWVPLVRLILFWVGEVSVCCSMKEMLHSQLRSILKCTQDYSDRIRILVPMVTNIEEIRALKEEICSTKELEKEGVTRIEDIPLGIRWRYLL